MKRKRIPIKPLSVNKAWKGRRFKSNDYKDYERQLLILLRTMKRDIHIPEGPVMFDLHIGVSPPFDIDNPVKMTLDILQKFQGQFDDKMVFDLHVRKTIVQKGNEYLAFEFTPFTGSIYNDDWIYDDD